LDRVVDTGAPVVANRVFSVVRKLCNWAVERDFISVSPCVGVKPPSAERSRDRVLTDEELARVWGAADRLSYPFAALIRLLVLTGQRRGEVAGLRWSEIKGDLWTLPAGRAKNAKEHDVPLSRAALDILAGMPRIGEDFVLTVAGTG